MKALIQRVKNARVEVDSQTVGEIGMGLLTFLGIEKGDQEECLSKMIHKILNLRIFEDDQGKMSCSLLDIGGEHLLVSQFTLAGDCSQGRRPSFLSAAPPSEAKPLYEKALQLSQELGVKTEGGQFQAMMEVSLINHGPATFWLEVR